MKRLALVLFLVSNFLYGCDDPLAWFKRKVYRIKIVNNSDNLIRFHPGYIYPDTLLPTFEPLLVGIEADNFFYLDMEEKWEEVFSELPADTLSIFFFSEDTLKLYTWDQIRADYKILDRYDLSLQDVKDNNWEVVFPRKDI
jgi:hypothetical protein